MVEETHKGAEGGLYNELFIMDTFMAGIVRWLNEIGITTEFSCDGHGKRKNKLKLINQNQNHVLDACLSVLSDGCWRYIENSIENTKMTSKGNKPIFERRWLLDVAEKIYINQAMIKILINERR